jgi:hypothetical protein
MSDSVLEYLSKKIDDEIDIIKEELSMGYAKDFGDYKHASGVVRGLMVAKNIIIETVEKMEKDDD